MSEWWLGWCSNLGLKNFNFFRGGGGGVSQHDDASTSKDDVDVSFPWLLNDIEVSTVSGIAPQADLTVTHLKFDGFTVKIDWNFEPLENPLEIDDLTHSKYWGLRLTAYSLPWLETWNRGEIVFRWWWYYRIFRDTLTTSRLAKTTGQILCYAWRDKKNCHFF